MDELKILIAEELAQARSDAAKLDRDGHGDHAVNYAYAYADGMADMEAVVHTFIRETS